MNHTDAMEGEKNIDQKGEMVTEVEVHTGVPDVEASSASSQAGKNSRGSQVVDLPILQSAFRRATWYSMTLTAIVAVVGACLPFGPWFQLLVQSAYSPLCFVVPLPMFFSHYIFSERFFTFWISVSMYVSLNSTALQCF